MSTRLISRNIALQDGRTSIRLEPEFWDALGDICSRERLSASKVVQGLDGDRREGGRTSAVRVHILSYFRSAATEAGHEAAGHGSRPRVSARLTGDRHTAE